MSQKRKLSRREYELACGGCGLRTEHKRQEGITEILTRRGLFIMPREVFAHYRDEKKLDSFYSPEWQRPQKTFLEHDLIGSSVDNFFSPHKSRLGNNATKPQAF